MALPTSKLDPHIKEIKELYNNGNSMNDIMEFIKAKYNIDLSIRTYQKKIKKLNIMRSNSEAIKLSSRKHLPIKQIISLYTNNGFSLRKIAKLFVSNKKTIHKILYENGIYVRNGRESQISIGYIKEKSKFELTLQEKAYLFGLVDGDLTPVKKSNFTLKLITHTTHPSFAKLLKTSFEKYGPFSANLNKYNEFRCSAYLDLSSFSFLLESKKDRIPKWIDKDNFFYYLAGFIDSDGCISIKKSHKYFQFVIKFSSENINLLKELKFKLKEIGYRVHLHRNHKIGDFSYHQDKYIIYNKDYYDLAITNKFQVLELLKILPIRHAEKIARRELIISIINQGLIYWNDVKEDVLELRQKIKEEVQNRSKIN